MTHWSYRTGVALVVGAYLTLAALIIWAPHPAIKAWAVAMIYPAPPYLMEGALMTFGAYISKEWGHGDDYKDISSFEREASREIHKWTGGYCDPNDPPWWC